MSDGSSALSERPCEKCGEPMTPFVGMNGKLVTICAECVDRYYTW
jgi:formylmethanofuran dehydrogenase subunit E